MPLLTHSCSGIAVLKLMWGSGKEGLKKDDAPSHLRGCLTQGAALTDPGRQGVAEGLIEAFDQAGADVHAQACQFLSAQHDPLAQDGQSPFSFLLAQLSIDPLGVGLKQGLTRSARLARGWKHLEAMIHPDQG